VGALASQPYRFERLDPLKDTRWATFVARAPGATVFHHTEWLSLLRRAYRYPIQAWCLVRADGTIAAGLPVALVSSRLTGRRLVCLPFSDHSPPLAAPGDDRAAGALGPALDEARRAAGVPLRVHGPLRAGPPVTVLGRYHHHVLPLQADADAVIRGFRRRSALLRGARRAQREGLRFDRRTDEDALAAFYRLNQLTRRRIGVPVQPRHFILGLRSLMRRGLGFVAVVRAEGQPVAAAVFLTLGGTLFYKYGASDPAALGRRPNNLLFLEVIRRGCEEGMQRVDFGRTDLDHESLRAFKLAFGAEERMLEYHALGERAAGPRGAGGAGRMAPVLQRSPLFVNRVVGELLYRHVG
jgi:CelD/BcsL family acetyltransferase involved in cellulose biosynthesis